MLLDLRSLVELRADATSELGAGELGGMELGGGGIEGEPVEEPSTIEQLIPAFVQGPVSGWYVGIVWQ